jgi:aldose 1-epimerase
VSALSLSQRPFGTVGNDLVECYRLEREGGIAVEILTYGGIIRTLEAPGRDGTRANVTLGFDNLPDYLERSPHFGCITGRYANRIRAGRFPLNGRIYELALNDPPNALHGGPRGFGTRVWRPTPLPPAGLSLVYTSADGEEGYPAELDLQVDYTLTEADELRIDYRARNASSDLATVLNVTNHAYWNLAGEGVGTILDQTLELAADAYTPTDETAIPTGELVSVEGTPFDFRTPTAIGARIGADDEQLRIGLGYDHNFVLRGDGLRLAARFHDPASGRTLEVLTTEPGLQVYSGNRLDGTLTGPGGRPYLQNGAVAFETQHFPDSPNQPAFPSTELAPGAEVVSTTIYRFSAE